MSLAWTVRLAEQAELDFLDIATWTVENFGGRQAEFYAETLLLAIEALRSGWFAPWLTGLVGKS
jgi:toxin ParE1/3/4